MNKFIFRVATFGGLLMSLSAAHAATPAVVYKCLVGDEMVQVNFSQSGVTADNEPYVGGTLKVLKVDQVALQKALSIRLSQVETSAGKILILEASTGLWSSRVRSDAGEPTSLMVVPVTRKDLKRAKVSIECKSSDQWAFEYEITEGKIAASMADHK